MASPGIAAEVEAEAETEGASVEPCTIAEEVEVGVVEAVEVAPAAEEEVEVVAGHNALGLSVHRSAAGSMLPGAVTECHRNYEGWDLIA